MKRPGTAEPGRMPLKPLEHVLFIMHIYFID